MPTDGGIIDQLEARARRAGATVVVIEVSASTGGYDRERGRAPRVLEVHAILAAPGRDDSRYRVEKLDELPADDPATADRSMALAAVVAARLGAALDPAGGAPPADGAPSWLARQGPPPPRSWAATWELRVWRDDGVAVDTHGTTVVTASQGYEAHYLTRLEITRGLKAPFVYAIALVDVPGERNTSSTHVADAPSAAPPANELRRLARAGHAPSAVIEHVAAMAPTLSPLERMITLEHAFVVALDQLQPAGAFCRGELSASELDCAVGPVIEARRPHWCLRLALAEAHAAGRPIGPVLRDAYPTVGNTIPLARALDDAFGLTLRDTKVLVGLACDGAHDDELERVLRRALQRD
jgi:hypothetical protein